jgi:hypothetical protein
LRLKVAGQSIPLGALKFEHCMMAASLFFDDWFQGRGNPTLGGQRAFYEWQGFATQTGW